AEKQRYERELAQARERMAQAQTEAERAKASEEVARLEAERARLESEQAKRERDEALEGLVISLAAILETRREARGLIVNLSDVYFDFDKATLKPGAKEKLSKLTGILLAYPGNYRIEIEGHTDSIGSDEYNQRLSESRAMTVRDYMTQAGLPADRIVATRGFGKARPVVTNDTPEGRQINRRVEIIIADTGLPTSASRQ
ncbi:MAG: OmpA family protein, partial [Blastocatellia bacterium]